jgi:hypothetical protein
MESDWEQSLGHNVPDCLIGECSSIVFAKPFRALSKGSVLMLRNTPATRKAEGSKESSNATFIFARAVNGLIVAGFSSDR